MKITATVINYDHEENHNYKKLEMKVKWKNLIQSLEMVYDKYESDQVILVVISDKTEGQRVKSANMHMAIF